MGLDGVELLMEIEDEYGLTIPDEDSVRLSNVGSLVRYIAAREGVETYVICQTARPFYAFRRMLVDRFDVPRSCVRPGARIASLVPRIRRDQLDVTMESMGLKHKPSRVRDVAVALAPRQAVFSRDDPDRLAEISANVRRIVAEQMGVHVDDISESTHFVRDLDF